MNMTTRLTRTALPAVLALGLVFGISAAASAQEGETGHPPLLHPCDVSNDNGILDTDLERLCMRIWDQRAYTVTNEDGTKYESAAGPVVVDDLVTEWMDEDAGIIWLRESFENERALYAKRDR